MAPPLSTTNSWDLLASKWPSECIWVFDAAVDSIHPSSKDSPISLDPQHHFQSFGRSHAAQVQDLAWMASGLDLLYEAWGGLQSRFIFTCYQRLSGIRCCNSGFPASMIYCQKMNIFECRAKFWGKPSQPHAQFYSSPFPRVAGTCLPSALLKACPTVCQKWHMNIWLKLNCFQSNCQRQSSGHVGESPQKPVKLVSHIGSIKRAINMCNVRNRTAHLKIQPR